MCNRGVVKKIITDIYPGTGGKNLKKLKENLTSFLIDISILSICNTNKYKQDMKMGVVPNLWRNKPC